MSVVPDAFPDRLYLLKTDAAMHALFLAMGKAIGTWAAVERSLAEIFQHLTGLDYLTARALFYAASSFDSKLRLVKAAVLASKAGGAQKKYLSQVLNITSGYSSARNKIVHRVPITIVSGREYGALTEGGGNAPLKEMVEDALTASKIDHAEENFHRLSWLLRQGIHPAVLAAPAQNFPKLLKLAQQLPSEPLANQPSRKQRGLERQRRAAAKEPISKQSKPTAH